MPIIGHFPLISDLPRHRCARPAKSQQPESARNRRSDGQEIQTGPEIRRGPTFGGGLHRRREARRVQGYHSGRRTDHPGRRLHAAEKPQRQTDHGHRHGTQLDRTSHHLKLPAEAEGVQKYPTDRVES